MRPEKKVDIAYSFDRFDLLERVRGLKSPLGPDDIRRKLHAVSLGDLTLQTMVFEPATLKLHVALGAAPASRLPLRTIDLWPLMKK